MTNILLICLGTFLSVFFGLGALVLYVENKNRPYLLFDKITKDKRTGLMFAFLILSFFFLFLTIKIGAFL